MSAQPRLVARRRWPLRRLVASLFCLGAAAWLASVIDDELRAAPRPIQEARIEKARAAAAAADAARFVLPPLPTYAEVVERPLFAPSRRPPPPAARAVVREDQPVFTLKGVAIASDSRFALIARTKTEKAVHVAEGETFDGWTVRTIEAARVVLERQGKTVELALLPPTDAAATPATTTPAAAAGNSARAQPLDLGRNRAR